MSFGEFYAIDAWGNLQDISGPTGMNGYGCNTEGPAYLISASNQISG